MKRKMRTTNNHFSISDGYFYDLEMHLIYTLAELDRTGITVETKPVLIVSVLFDAACNKNFSSKFLDS